MEQLQESRPRGEPLAEIWRGGFLESIHRGHAVARDSSGRIVEAWGDPGAVILPRSSCKMIQALPLVESGAADRHGLPEEILALSCASHQGSRAHASKVLGWLESLGLGEPDLLCGRQPPSDRAEREALIRAGKDPTQAHNNCSGKHAGFLTLARHLGAGPDYIDPSHPVQKAVREAFESMTGAPSPGFATDGCSAPNFATTVSGLALAMARFAAAVDSPSTSREKAASRLYRAMVSHPVMVAGEGRACTELMQALDGAAMLKTGAEGVFVAAIPKKGIGVALKIEDGAKRASECAVTALLARLGLIDPRHPAAQKRLNAPIVNWKGVQTGSVRAAASLLPPGQA